MTTASLPACPCGAHDWTSGGGGYSPQQSTAWHRCTSCKQIALRISAQGSHTLLIPVGQTEQFSDQMNLWVNEVLLVACRDRAARLKKAQEVIEKRWINYACDEVGIPRGSNYEHVPEEKSKQWADFWKLLDEYPAFKTPSGFETPLIPPQLPENLLAYTLHTNKAHESEWVLVERTESLNQPIPRDPIRIAHDLYFADVFRILANNLRHDIDLQEIPNQYSGAANEPWYTFKLGSCTIVLGPRKRVTAIKVTSLEPFSVEGIREAAVEHDTTYYADSVLQNSAPTARTIDVHAWNKEQLIQFLDIIRTFAA